MQTPITDKKIYTYGEYLELENSSDDRYEYYNGEVFAMAGTSKTHNEIASNVTGLLKNQFKPKGCDVFQEGIKLEIEKNNFYFYPDIIVSCDAEDSKDPYYVRNPFLIVEVLSESTFNYERSVKLYHYRKIKSLRYYLLISQQKSMIELYRRQVNTDIFSYTVFEGSKDILASDLNDFHLALSDVYNGINFTAN